jgi:beta-1,4-mannosyltransferase
VHSLGLGGLPSVERKSESRSRAHLRVLAYPGPANRGSNPYTSLLYSHMGHQVEVSEFCLKRGLRGHFDIVHLHWPELPLNATSSAAAFLRVMKQIAILVRLRRNGAKVVWTVHNLASHDQRHPALESWFWHEFLKQLDGYICLTNHGRLAAQERFPALRSLPAFVIPHGHYRGEYPVDLSVDPRHALHLPNDARVILFFGKLREYKNVVSLVRAFRELQLPKAVLLIAGDGPPGLLREIDTVAAGDARVRLHAGHIPADRVSDFFQAADLVALPYRDILNSGAAVLALSFNRPVLVPALGAMRELGASIGTEWVRTFSGNLTPHILQTALAWAVAGERTAEAPLDTLHWDLIARQTLCAFRVISNHPAVAAPARKLETTRPSGTTEPPWVNRGAVWKTTIHS